MPILHVRNVPDELYAQLQRRADAQRRSLSAEVITLLDWAIREVERASATTLASIRSRRTFDPAAAGASDSTALLREDRER
jgi:plasmid stability protein